MEFIFTNMTCPFYSRDFSWLICTCIEASLLCCGGGSFGNIAAFHHGGLCGSIGGTKKPWVDDEQRRSRRWDSTPRVVGEACGSNSEILVSKHQKSIQRFWCPILNPVQWSIRHIDIPSLSFFLSFHREGGTHPMGGVVGPQQQWPQPSLQQSQRPSPPISGTNNWLADHCRATAATPTARYWEDSLVDRR